MSKERKRAATHAPTKKLPPNKISSNNADILSVSKVDTKRDRSTSSYMTRKAKKLPPNPDGLNGLNGVNKTPTIKPSLYKKYKHKQKNSLIYKSQLIKSLPQKPLPKTPLIKYCAPKKNINVLNINNDNIMNVLMISMINLKY